MKSIDHKILDEVRNTFPDGTEVVLTGKIKGKKKPRIGCLGKVDYVDDDGLIMVNWDDGSHTGVFYEDKITEPVW